MSKDFHGLCNTLIGISLALVVGLYPLSLPPVGTFFIGFSAAVLIWREVWLMGHQLHWSVKSKYKVG